jgi:hypothetical protein
MLPLAAYLTTTFQRWKKCRSFGVWPRMVWRIGSSVSMVYDVSVFIVEVFTVYPLWFRTIPLFFPYRNSVSDLGHLLRWAFRLLSHGTWLRAALKTGIERLGGVCFHLQGITSWRVRWPPSLTIVAVDGWLKFQAWWCVRMCYVKSGYFPYCVARLVGTFRFRRCECRLSVQASANQRPSRAYAALCIENSLHVHLL